MMYHSITASHPSCINTLSCLNSDWPNLSGRARYKRRPLCSPNSSYNQSNLNIKTPISPVAFGLEPYQSVKPPGECRIIKKI